VILTVKVVPRASKLGLAVEPDGSLTVRLHSPPVDGAANAELIEVLAEAYHVPRRAITIVGGAHARTKRVQIDGIDDSQGLSPKAQGQPGSIAAGGRPTRRPRRTLRR
jgi:uncharacterized protein (TIGR00251 family)